MSAAGRIALASLDDFGWVDVARLHRIGAHGPLTIALLSDAMVEARTGSAPRFTIDERRYIAQALRCVTQVIDVFDEISLENLRHTSAGYDWFELDSRSPRYVADAPAPTATSHDWFAPGWIEAAHRAERPFVAVSGCYDGLHSGHIRFFEEASELGSLFVTVGSDESIHGHKGEGHPHVGEADRLRMVGAVRYVAAATIAGGSGWLDAAPDLESLRPDYWVVNDDGDRLEKRDFASALGIELRVLRREPKSGLPARSSTALRAEDARREID